jgi:hypothetical protein
MATASSRKDPPASPLEAFLTSIEAFVSQVGHIATEAAPAQGEHRILLRATKESMDGQAAKLSAFVRASAQRLSEPQMAQLNEFLGVQEGDAIAKRGVEAMQRSVKGKLTGTLLHWISKHLKELKKLLEAGLRIILDLLHLPWPDWIDTVLLVLDQLTDELLSLLGELFGLDLGTTARQMARAEEDHLLQMGALQRLRAANAAARMGRQDEA